ncbi:MAG TPA: hypothetical protein VFJ12_05650 [Segeticoccus sp.]|nr:hypothetical protein [Segeticoccus sp.]
MSDSNDASGTGQVSEGGFQSNTGTGPHIATTPSGGLNQAGAASDDGNEVTYEGGDTGAGAGGLLPGRQEEAQAELAAEALDGDAVPSGTGRDTAQLPDAGTEPPSVTPRPDPDQVAGPAAAEVNAHPGEDDVGVYPGDEQADEDEGDDGDQPVAPI